MLLVFLVVVARMQILDSLSTNDSKAVDELFASKATIRKNISEKRAEIKADKDAFYASKKAFYEHVQEQRKLREEQDKKREEEEAAAALKETA
jgi:hypothetical protein